MLLETSCPDDADASGLPATSTQHIGNTTNRISRSVTACQQPFDCERAAKVAKRLQVS
jgi:hypothetical protein